MDSTGSDFDHEVGGDIGNKPYQVWSNSDSIGWLQEDPLMLDIWTDYSTSPQASNHLIDPTAPASTGIEPLQSPMVQQAYQGGFQFPDAEPGFAAAVDEFALDLAVPHPEIWDDMTASDLVTMSGDPVGAIRCTVCGRTQSNVSGLR